MAKVISQETFDDVVKENIVDFSMDPDEAKQETIKQFEAQGINLGNIIKDLSLNSDTGKPILNETVDNIKTHIGEKSRDIQKLIEYLSTLEQECQKGAKDTMIKCYKKAIPQLKCDVRELYSCKSIPHRVLAGKNGAHDALITLLEHELIAVSNSAAEPNLEVLEKCLRAINSLTCKQPDIFDAEALAIIIKLLNVENDDIICLILQWLQKACIMHEINRQNIMNAGIIRSLKPLVKKNNVRVIREVAAVFRFLVLDDDIRVEFSSAHEHARQIASEVVVDLCNLLGEYEDIDVLSDLILTIGTLAVRQEFCKSIEDAGGLKLVIKIMTENSNSVRLNREALKLLRALAGNDAVKAHIINQGAAPIIKDLLHMNMTNELIVTASLACIATLTLRVKTNSVAFFETGIAETIVEAMRLHPKNKIIQRNGAWAIRNMVSRSRDQCDTWMSFGVENLLNTAMMEHPPIQQDIRAALRDLGCKVDLKEEWTGTAEKKILNN